MHDVYDIGSNCYSQRETSEIASRNGHKKATMRIDKIIVSAFMAGSYLGFSCSVSLVINTSPWVRIQART